MPERILPHLEGLSAQIGGIVGYYRRLLDDDFVFASGAQVPQAATIFDRVGDHTLRFGGEAVTLVELLAMVAYRYGFESVRRVGHGGYAIVLGHRDDPAAGQARRVLRLVPDHHVRAVVREAADAPEYAVQLDERGEPIRDAVYPLLLSDLFLMPRHTTQLSFYTAAGEIVQAGGYPAILHCQLLPEVLDFKRAALEPRLARAAGDLLEAALASLGVNVADAHGGNGGVLVGAGGRPATWWTPDRTPHYIPVVLDFGYFSTIGAQTLADILVRYGVTPKLALASVALEGLPSSLEPWREALATWIAQSGLPRSAFGRLLYHTPGSILKPWIWVDRARWQWRTVKERAYPPLLARDRLSYLYPRYDEVTFPQRIEAYSFTL